MATSKSRENWGHEFSMQPGSMMVPVRNWCVLDCAAPYVDGHAIVIEDRETRDAIMRFLEISTAAGDHVIFTSPSGGRGFRSGCLRWGYTVQARGDKIVSFQLVVFVALRARTFARTRSGHRFMAVPDYDVSGWDGDSGIRISRAANA